MADIIMGRIRPSKFAMTLGSGAVLQGGLREALDSGARHNFRFADGPRVHTFSAIARRDKLNPAKVRLVYVRDWASA